jgi:23S rRNA (uracil1939-C5)-methyltransferase
MSLRPQAQRALRLEQVRALGIPAETIESDAPLGYRASAKRVAFRDRAGRLRLGSFARGSHHGASMLGCRVDHPLIEAGFAALERAAEQLEAARPAVLGESIRHVWIKTNGARLLVTLIVAADADETDLAAWLDLVEMIGPPAGYALAVHEGQGNAVRGGPARPFRGVASLETALCGVPLHIEPLGFLQPNPAVAGRAYEALCALPDGTPLRGARALDLFAGAGVTTALLRRAFDTVRPVESYPESAAALGVPAEDAAEAVRAWVEAAEAPPDLIVANPPRAGFGPALCRALLALAAPRIHVMSCNPHSLARDLERLAPSYRLEAARAFDTLPQTPHVEVVAWLVRTEEAR